MYLNFKNKCKLEYLGALGSSTHNRLLPADVSVGRLWFPWGLALSLVISVINIYY